MTPPHPGQTYVPAETDAMGRSAYPVGPVGPSAYARFTTFTTP
jgi:hypothetical protein